MYTGQIIFALAGIAFGALLTFIVSRIGRGRDKVRISTLEADAQALGKDLESSRSSCMELLSKSESMKTRAELAEQRITELKSQMEQSSRELLDAKEKAYADALEAIRKSHEQALQEQKERFDNAMAAMTRQFKASTDDMLKEREKEFSESSSTRLSDLMTPLKETMEQMQKAIEGNSRSQISLTAEMRTSVEHMIRHSDAARQSAQQLANALTHGSKTQGDWGEAVLDELLEAQGLTRGIHYDTQITMRGTDGSVLKSDEGSMMRPDVILHMDRTREVIIDSKVSLTAYIDYMNAESPEERQRCLKAHVDSLNRHVRELSQKDYSSYIVKPKTRMDYVIMFVPNTNALMCAMDFQPDLWRRAMEKNVFIADEQTLYAALKIIRLTWAQIQQAENHEKVFQLAETILDRAGQFNEYYEKVGKALEAATNAYDEGHRKLTSGRQNIMTPCRNLIDLGARKSRQHPLPAPDDTEAPANE